MQRTVRLTLIVTAMLLVALSSSRPLAAQTGVFSGAVFADSSEKPLANAEIVFTDLKRSVRSDDAGNFLFSGLPLGKHNVTVRMVGYESVATTITLVGAKPLEVDLFLKQTTTVLMNVEVTAAASPWAAKLVDFEERRKMGMGKFLTADDIAKENGRPLSAFILQKVPGLRILSLNGEKFLSSTRSNGSNKSPTGFGGTEFKKYPPGCYMKVIVNGRVEFDGTKGQEPYDVDRLNSLDIIGFEFYTTATTPVRYGSTTGSDSPACGTVIIWTKGG